MLDIFAIAEMLDRQTALRRERSPYVLTSAKPMKRSRKDRNKRKNRKAAAKQSKKRNR